MSAAAVPAAIVQMLSARVAAMLVTLVGTALLARLLTPADFGVFAFAMAVFAVIRALAELGLMPFLVRRDVIDTAELGAAAGLALVAALALSLLSIGAAFAFGSAHHAALAAVLAAALVAEAVALPYEALRRQAIDFRLLSGLALCQALVEAGVAIVLVLQGADALALAAGVFGSRLTATALLVLACPAPSRPRPRLAGWRRFARFGTEFVAAKLLPRLGELTIVSLLAHTLGLTSLGFYNRAGAVHAILDRTLFEAINPVILPALGHSLRAGVSPHRLYAEKIDYLVAVCWPAFAFIALFAELLVAVLLGAQWDQAVGPVRILALAGLVMPFTKTSMKLFIAMDRVDVQLRIQALGVAASVAGAALGSLHSLEAVCLGLVAAQGVRAALVWLAVGVASGEPARLSVTVLLRGSAITAGALLGPVFVTRLDGVGAVSQLAVSALLASVGWGVTLLVTRHRLADDVRGLLRGVITARGA